MSKSGIRGIGRRSRGFEFALRGRERDRSSHPPTWVSPMNICGTVRCLVFSIISSRRSGSMIDTDLLDLGHPAFGQQASGADAIRADGRGVHQDMSRHFSAAFLDRVTSAYPGIDAASQVVQLGETLFFSSPQTLVERMPEAQQTMIGLSLNFSSSPIRSASLPPGMFYRIRQVPGGVFVHLANIEDVRIFAVDQLGGLARGNAVSPTDA